MVTGNWYNQDGLYIQYGTSKAIPEVGGDYLVYGETREIEQLIPIVPMQVGNGNIAVPAPATSFSGTGTAAAAGIQSLTTMFPLAQVAPVTAVASSQYTFVSPQIFIEQVEVDTMLAVTQSGVTTGTISVGLVCTSPQVNANAQFAQITSSVGSAGQQILNAFPVVTASAVTVQGAAGSKTLYTAATQGFTFNTTNGGAAVATGGGAWTGIFSPIPTNAITPLPQSAWISTVITTNAGTLTGGLLKLRVKYVMFGGTNY